MVYMKDARLTCLTTYKNWRGQVRESRRGTVQVAQLRAHAICTVRCGKKTCEEMVGYWGVDKEPCSLMSIDHRTLNLSFWTYFSNRVLGYLDGRIREENHLPTTYRPHSICKTKAIICSILMVISIFYIIISFHFIYIWSHLIIWKSKAFNP